ncbi:hypothetical protein Patl1_15697 [Pistacia atlantica]|uniref:Uncharacterized protein n=1 Tax=Pistacia atlantica TaxID=434234 RepID=A0ACC1BBF6_9ROSI|nr:hypothetical protein Patl1_15697 [Pistacia atlantica]
MAAFSYCQSVQYLRVSSKTHILFSRGRDTQKKTNALVLASTNKSDNNLPLHSKVRKLLDSIKWDDKGLAVAIAQNVDTGAILMQGFVNRDALATIISSRKATFYSRSRSTLWTKGKTSKNFINVHDIFLDCDRDSVIYLGKPDGPTCHTGLETCYYTSVSDLLREEADELCRTMEENEDKSHTASEMTDVLYHAMVLLALKDVKAKDVLEVLRKKFSVRH